MLFLYQAKYNAACLQRDDFRQENAQIQAEICDLKEMLERSVASNKIEVRSVPFIVVYTQQQVKQNSDEISSVSEYRCFSLSKVNT